MIYSREQQWIRPLLLMLVILHVGVTHAQVSDYGYIPLFMSEAAHCDSEATSFLTDENVCSASAQMKYLIAGWTQSRKLVTGVSKITDCLEQKIPFVYMLDQGQGTGLWFKHAIKYGTAQDTLYRVREVSSIFAKDERGWTWDTTDIYPYDEAGQDQCLKKSFDKFAVALVLEQNSDSSVQANMILTLDSALVVKLAYVLKNNVAEEIVRPGNLAIWTVSAYNDKIAWFTSANTFILSANADLKWSTVYSQTHTREDYNLQASSANLQTRKGLGGVVEVDGNLIIAGTSYKMDSNGKFQDSPFITFQDKAGSDYWVSTLVRPFPKGSGSNFQIDELKKVLTIKLVVGIGFYRKDNGNVNTNTNDLKGLLFLIDPTGTLTSKFYKTYGGTASNPLQVISMIYVIPTGHIKYLGMSANFYGNDKSGIQFFFALSDDENDLGKVGNSKNSLLVIPFFSLNNFKVTTDSVIYGQCVDASCTVVAAINAENSASKIPLILTDNPAISLLNKYQRLGNIVRVEETETPSATIVGVTTLSSQIDSIDFGLGSTVKHKMNQPVAVFNTKTLYTANEYGLSSAPTYSSDVNDRQDTLKTFVLIKSFETERVAFTVAEKSEIEFFMSSSPPPLKYNVFSNIAPVSGNGNYQYQKFSFDQQSSVPSAIKIDTQGGTDLFQSEIKIVSTTQPDEKDCILVSLADNPMTDELNVINFDDMTSSNTVNLKEVIVYDLFQSIACYSTTPLNCGAHCPIFFTINPSTVLGTNASPFGIVNPSVVQDAYQFPNFNYAADKKDLSLQFVLKDSTKPVVKFYMYLAFNFAEETNPLSVNKLSWITNKNSMVEGSFLFSPQHAYAGYPSCSPDCLSNDLTTLIGEQIPLQLEDFNNVCGLLLSKQVSDLTVTNLAEKFYFYDGCPVKLSFQQYTQMANGQMTFLDGSNPQSKKVTFDKSQMPFDVDFSDLFKKSDSYELAGLQIRAIIINADLLNLYQQQKQGRNGTVLSFGLKNPSEVISKKTHTFENVIIVKGETRESVRELVSYESTAKFEMTITVCEAEQVASSFSGVTLVTGKQETGTNIEIPLLQNFTGSTDCQLSYSVVNSSDPDTVLSQDNFKVNSTHITVLPAATNGTLFDVKVQNIAAVSKLANFKLQYDPVVVDPVVVSNKTEEKTVDQISTIKAITSVLTNKSPSFTSPLPREIKVEIKKYINGTIEDSTKFQYQSPTSSDPEGDKIEMTISGLDGLAGVRTKKQSGGSFILTVDRGVINYSATKTCQVRLIDNLATPNLFSFVLKIVYSEEKVQFLEKPKFKKKITDLLSEDDKNQLTEIQNLIDQIGETQLSASETISKRTEYLAELEQVEEYIMLTQSGFVYDPLLGFNFKGVDPNESRKKVKMQKVTVTEAPSMKIEPISAKGEVNIVFDQDMIAPSSIDQSQYQHLFKILYHPYSGKISEAQFGSKNASRRLEEENESEIWANVLEHTARNIKFQINFLNPQNVSRQQETDNLVIVFLQPAFFKSAETLTPINAKSTVIKPLPKFIDEETQEGIASSTRRGGQLMTSISSSNFFVMLVMGGSMQQMWGMIRATQGIIFVSLVTVPTPGHTFYFFQGCMMFAQMDVLDGGRFYSLMFEFKETGSLNDNYDLIGIEDKNFIMNSGSYFIIILIIVLLRFSQQGFHLIALKNTHRPQCRKYGRKLYIKSVSRTIGLQTLKIYMESFVDLALCSFLGVLAFWRDHSEGRGIYEFLESKDDKFCTILTIFYALNVLVFPVWGIYMIFKHQKNIESQNKGMINLLVDGNKTKNFHQAMFQVYFILRRLVTAFILVFMDFFPYAQCFLLTVLSLCNVVYMVTFQPLEHNNLVEIYNEVTIYIVCILMSNFMNTAVPDELTNILGWVLIGVASLNILINLVITLLMSVKGSYKAQRERRSLKKAIQAWNNRMRSHNALVEEYPEHSEIFKHEIDQYNAIKFCRKWNKDRRWLLKNKMDVSEFPEEKEMIKLINKFNLREKAYVQRLHRCIDSLAAKKVLDAIVVEKRRNVKINFIENRPDIWDSEVAKQAIENQKRIRDINAVALNLVPVDSLKSPTKFKGIKSLKTRVFDWTIGKMETIKEEDIEERETQKDQPQQEIDESNNKQSLFKKQKDKILLETKLRSVNELNVYEVELSQEKKSEQIYALRVQGAKEPEIEDQVICEILLNKEETSFLGYKESSYTKLVHHKLQKKNINLNFLLENDDENYGEELDRQLEEKAPLIEQYRKNHEILSMKNGGKNDFMQALFQCFMKVEMLAEFFLNERYTEIELKDKAQSVCGFMKGVFLDYSGNHLEFIKKMRPPVDLYMLVGILHEIHGEDSFLNVESFYDFFIKELSEETNFKVDCPLINSPQQIVNNAFMICVVKLKICKNLDTIRSEERHQFSIHLSGIESFDNCMNKMFNGEDLILAYCNQCRSFKVRNQTFITKFPKLMVFTFQVFDKKKSIITTKGREIPEGFNLQTYQTNLFEGTEQNAPDYKLSSMITIEGPDLNSSQYIALVNRFNEKTQKNEWFSFFKNQKATVPLEEVLTQQNPQMVIFERVDQ